MATALGICRAATAEAPESECRRLASKSHRFFVLARLEKEGFQPSAEADRATLIRRLSFDLTGLPPTPKEVDDYVNDTSPNAYEKVVDRLLASRALW